MRTTWRRHSTSSAILKSLPLLKRLKQLTTNVMNTTRDCSFLYNRDKSSVICHSARHRSTFRLSRDATTTVFPRNGNPYQRPFANCRRAFHAFLYWSEQGQAAVDSYIEAIELDSSLETAETAAFQASRPGWRIKKYPCHTGKGSLLSAANTAGGFEVRVGGSTIQELHTLTK
jgi:hypothetical protein